MGIGAEAGPKPIAAAVVLPARCKQRGVGDDDTVALMLPNVPAMFEAHFAIPMAGAVINALNIRLDADAIAFQLEHGGASVLITDREFSVTMLSRRAGATR